LELYKKKLEQIYDLCVQCKKKVNLHLQKQDQAIGNCVLKQRNTASTVAALNNNNTQNKKPINVNDTRKVEIKQDTNGNIPKSLSTSFKKAYTIAGTVPNIIFNYSKSPSKICARNEIKIDTNKPAYYEADLNDAKKNAFDKNSINIIIGDFIVLLTTVLVFASDLVNLMNDSDIFKDETDGQSLLKQEYFWFQFFLTFYKHSVTVLFVVLLITIHHGYKR
jgi:hypothetical protein